MRNYVFAVGIAFALASCGRDSDQAVAPAASSDAKLETTPVVLPSQTEFPSGFVPAFEYRIRSKKSDEQSGERFRKLVVEFKGAGAAEIDKSIEKTLSGLGYRRYKTFQTADGGLVGDYGSNGHRITATTTQARPGMNLLDPASKGTVYFVWKD